MSTKQVDTLDAAQPVSRAAILEQFPAMLAAVPDAPDDDGSGIAAAILQATDAESLNVGGSLPDAEAMIGQVLRIEHIGKRVSELPDSPLPFYLICEGTAGPHRKKVTFQTSAQTVVAQLVKAHQLGLFPLVCEVVKSEKATRAGRWPLALKVHSGGTH